MSELMIIKGQVIVPSETELIEAFKSPKLSVLAPYEIGNKLKDALTKSYYHLGYKAPDTEEFIKLQIYLADFLTAEKIYQNVGVDEIVIAIRRGSDRQYGEFFGINPATITGWIKAYMDSESRKNGKIIQMHIEASKEIPKANPTPQEQWNMFVERLKVLYENFLTGINIQPSEATFVFKILRRSRIINFDEARRNKLKAQALMQIKQETDPKNALTRDERLKLSNKYELLIAKAQEDPQVISRAMALGLIEWFEDLKQFGTSIEEAVNDEF
jgi:hypothetical protein